MVLWSLPADHALLDTYQAVAMLNNTNAALFDLRPKPEFEKGHIPGAKNIDIERLIDRAKDLAKSRPLLLVCKDGRSSLQQLSKLREAGHEDVHALKGGLLAWREANQPLLTVRK